MIGAPGSEPTYIGVRKGLIDFKIDSAVYRMKDSPYTIMRRRHW